MHIPVLQQEVIKYLDPEPNENFIDCTIGGGGHAKLILEKTAPHGKILGIDADPEVLGLLKQETSDFKSRVVLVNGSFANLKEIIEECKFKKISGILLDLGFSSWHIDESKRGFTFLKNEPLDMRYDPQNQETAEKIVNFRSEPDIEKILREYGEEQFSRQIAKEIVEARKVVAPKNTFQLVEIIRRAVPRRYLSEKIHFATKTFQALRIATNGELDNLGRALPQAAEILPGGGRLAVISFHSLEDGIVKDFFKKQTAAGTFQMLTKKPTQPVKEEIMTNPRSRSAKLRAAVKL